MTSELAIVESEAIVVAGQEQRALCEFIDGRDAIAGDPTNPSAPPDTYIRAYNPAAQFTNAGTQNGVAVLWGQSSFYAGNPFSYMNYVALQSGMWTGGAADCSAVMYYTSGKRTVTLSTLNYHVDA